ncbi:MAG TPA: serine hydrolase domain-containing protein [Candidatus Micrarchaeia archaeon]|nr:serine hydrolase domain-containing protein [Candidatus Micrarchaeia archaeon]
MGAPEARLAELIEPSLGDANLPGVAIGVTDAARPIFCGTFGSASLESGRAVDTATLFEIGSISKSFTSTLVLRQVERGVIDLDRPVQIELPWLAVGPHTAAITPRLLLAHRAGLIQGAESTPEAVSEVLALTRGPAACPPGAFHYSNVGYKLLGVLLEAVGGRPYPDLLREDVLGPLGMTATVSAITNDVRQRMAVGHDAFLDDRPLPPGGRLGPATWLETATADGSIAATALDMTAFVRMLLDGGGGPGGRLLAPPSFAEMTRPWSAPGAPAAEGYALGLVVGQGPRGTVLHHGGGMVGFRSELIADLGRRLGVVVLANGPGDPSWIARAALTLFAGEGDGSDPASASAPDPWTVGDGAAYVGRYADGTRRFEIGDAGHGRLGLRCGGVAARISRAGTGALLAAHPRLDRFLLEEERIDGRVVGFHHGGDWYGRQGEPRPAATAGVDGLLAFVGHYRSYNPWFAHLRVVARAGELVAIAPGGTEAFEGSLRLVPVGPTRFRLGSDPTTPEVIGFDDMVEGRFMRAHLSGGDFHRTASP